MNQSSVVEVQHNELPCNELWRINMDMVEGVSHLVEFVHRNEPQTSCRVTGLLDGGMLHSSSIILPPLLFM